MLNSAHTSVHEAPWQPPFNFILYSIRKESVSISIRASYSPSAVLGVAECPAGFPSLPQLVNALFSPTVGSKSKLHWLFPAFSCSQCNLLLNCSRGCLRKSAHKTQDIKLLLHAAFPPVPRSNPAVRERSSLENLCPTIKIFPFPEKLVRAWEINFMKLLHTKVQWLCSIAFMAYHFPSPW